VTSMLSGFVDPRSFVELRVAHGGRKILGEKTRFQTRKDAEVRIELAITAVFVSRLRKSKASR
jgi:hypothetical protein